MTGVADFSGYATRTNLRCSDGRTILADAFAHQHDTEVPLLWHHGHDDVKNVLGHARLENVADGVKAYAYFNDTDAGRHAKKMVQNGDVKFLSIFANQLREHSKQVVKGHINEVSLVLAGANPGAVIENVTLAHSDGAVETYDDEAIITTGIELEVLSHAATDTVEDEDEDLNVEDLDLVEIVGTFNKKQEYAFNFLMSQALSGELQHSATDGDAVADDEGADGSEEDEASAESSETDESSEGDGADEASDSEEEEGTDGSDSEDEESDADGEAEDGTEDEGSEGGSDADEDTENDNEAGDATVQHDSIKEDNSMTSNVFDQSELNGAGGEGKKATLSHDAVKEIMKQGVQAGTSLRAVLEGGAALKHGIENIDYLFPDAKLLETSPNYLARRVEWVQKVLNGVKRTPFTRIKTITADITADDARARGYIKGTQKVEEVFELMKRETTPQTVYKLQKLDRDDVLDITDLDVIAWMKAEMKLMLDEEIASAILIGDGRSNLDDAKIKEDKIRPIATDVELYTVKATVNLDDASSSIEELVDSVINNRQYYKGTGNPSFYTSEAVIAKFLTVKDNFGHRMYKNLADIAEVLRVSEVVAVDTFGRQPNLVGIMVNLSDYSIGTDRGGQATMFDDFDLDFNKLRYLLETRISGALTLPKSAIAFWKTASTNVAVTPNAPTFDAETNVVTIPSQTGVVYKNADTNATLTAGAQDALEEGEELNVQATPASGYYFPSSEGDSWHYEYQA